MFAVIAEATEAESEAQQNLVEELSGIRNEWVVLRPYLYKVTTD